MNNKTPFDPELIQQYNEWLVQALTIAEFLVVNSATASLKLHNDLKKQGITIEPTLLFSEFIEILKGLLHFKPEAEA